MSRADYRRGRAPIRTANELAILMPVPVFLLISGYAKPVYPRTDRSNPSPHVGIMTVKTIPDTYPSLKGALPVWVHWTQWQDVIVPVVADPRVTEWRSRISSTGDALTLANDIMIPQSGGQVQYAAGASVGTSACSLSTQGGLYLQYLSQYLAPLGGIIKAQAVAQGY